jgi:hypothetical protein
VSDKSTEKVITKHDVRPPSQIVAVRITILRTDGLSSAIVEKNLAIAIKVEAQCFTDRFPASVHARH